MSKRKRKRKGQRSSGRVEASAPTLSALEIPTRSESSTVATPANSPALPAVWACVDLINVTVQQIPLRAEVGGDPVPLPEWLRRPERWNGGAADLPELVEALTTGQALHGAGYLYAEPLGAQSWRLYPLDPSRVAVEWEQRDRIRTRAYRLDGSRVPTARRFTTRDSRAGIVPVPHRLLPGVAAGVGPIQAARISVGNYLEAESYGSDIYGDAVPAGVLKTEQDIPADTAARYQDAWIAGADKPVRVLGSGLNFEALKLNPKDAAWLDARRFNGEEVCRLYLVPAYKLNLAVSGGMTYSNAESLERDFLRGCIAGYIDPIERALDGLTPEGRNADEAMAVAFDYRGLLRSTTAERYASYQTAIAAGFLTVDEARELEGLPPLPAGSVGSSG